MTFLKLKMTLDIAENDTIEKHRPQEPLYRSRIVFLALLEVIQTQKRAKLAKFRKFDLEMWPFDLEDDLRCH